MGKANRWRPKTRQLQWSGSNHHSGLHFCNFSTTLVSTFNWCNRRLHLPVGICRYLPLNYQYFSSAHSAYVCLTCYPRAPGFPCHVLLVAAGWWVHLLLQHLEYFHLEMIQSEVHWRVSDTYRTSWFLFVWLLGSFIYESRRYVSLFSSCQIAKILILEEWERARSLDML